jgi:hypothetical protein
MAFTLADRIRETSTTTGTGSYTLAGAVSGFRTFSSGIGANSCTYNVTMGSQWEIGLGTVSGSTLTRDTILASSNAGAAVNWTAGTKDIRCDVSATTLNPMIGAAPTDLRPIIATTSGSTKTFTGIPVTAKRITVLINQVSFAASDDLLIQLGDAGGIETTGYAGLVTTLRAPGDVEIETYTSGWAIGTVLGSGVSIQGMADLCLFEASSNTWIGRATVTSGGSELAQSTVIKSLTSTLTQVRIAAAGETFDAGSLAIQVSV